MFPLSLLFELNTAHGGGRERLDTTEFLLRCLYIGLFVGVFSYVPYHLSHSWWNSASISSQTHFPLVCICKSFPLNTVNEREYQQWTRCFIKTTKKKVNLRDSRKQVLEQPGLFAYFNTHSERDKQRNKAFLCMWFVHRMWPIHGDE